MSIVPVIAVFTKYDKLITRLERTMDPSRRAGLDAKQLAELAEDDAKKALENITIDPFEGSVDKEEVPLIHVSSMSRDPNRHARHYATHLIHMRISP
jgi:hypothetical protein